MGIPGLLIALKSVTYRVHISEYRGFTVGVDAYCWLHRGAFSCGTELCTGVATEKYVTFCMKRVNLMRQHGVKPIMVFDGASLPLKGEKHLERRRQRDAARSKGQTALAAGEAGAAAHHFSKAVAVTHDMAFALIKELRRSRVELIVAPYEADAQLAYLSRYGVVDAVITEDSDCLPYGCKKVLFKMDNEGHGQEIQLRNLAANSPLTLCNWKNSMFLDLCLLVGCDYMTASVKGLGIATAHSLVERHRRLDKIIRAVESSKFVVPEAYWKEYKRARLTFRHHIVFDTHTQSTVHLMPLGQTAKDGGNLDFLGFHLSSEVVKGVAYGHLHPNTHKPYEEFDHTEPGPLMPSMPLALLPATNRSYTTPTMSSHSGPATNDVDIDEPNSMKCVPVLNTSSPPVDVVETCGPTFTRHSSDDPRYRQASELSVQPALAGAFIDTPFGTDRPALKDLPFPPEGTSQGSTGWSAPAPTRESTNMPGLQGNQTYGDSTSEASGRWSGRAGCGTSPLSYLGQQHSGLDETENPSNYDGISSLQLPGTETRIGLGVDTRMRERGRPCATTGFSPAFQASRNDSLQPLLSVEGTARSANSPPLRSSGHASGVAWAQRWGVASPLSRGGDWSRPNEQRWGQSSGIDVNFGTSTEARQVQVRLHGGSSSHAEENSDGGRQSDCSSHWAYDSRTAEVTALGEGDSVPEDAYHQGSNVGGANANANATNISCGQEGARRGTSALALAEPPDFDRAKFVPTSAHHFHTTQVSQGLETLQRRKRRLGQAGDVALSSPLSHNHNRHDLHYVNGIRDGRPYDRVGGDSGYSPIAPMEGGSSNPSSLSNRDVWSPEAENWMVQADTDTSQTQPGSGAQLSEPESTKVTDGWRGIASFREGTKRVSPLRLSSTRSPTVTVTPSQQGNEKVASPFPCGEKKTSVVGDQARTFNTSSRRWMVTPNTVPDPTREVELPLLRLLDGSRDHSWQGRLDGGRSSTSSTKRTRGTEFWDARLMR